MPTQNYVPPKPSREKKMKKTKKKERYVTGPNGEKRPTSVTANAVRVMQIATGIAEEEYVEKPSKTKD